MKFDVDDKNRCSLVCAKFHLNRCRFAVTVAKCLGGSLFWDTVYTNHWAWRCPQNKLPRPPGDPGPSWYLVPRAHPTP